MPGTHPTKTLLIETAIGLIDEFGPQGFTVDVLLDTSKISKGSLYHHFENFDDVIEQAQVARFARSVDIDVNQMTLILTDVNTQDELLERLSAIVANATLPDRRNVRFNRAEIIGHANHSVKYARSLAIEQQRLTDAFSDVIRELQERGWVDSAVDPVVGATFLQAYTLGFVLNDITQQPISDEAWQQFIVRMLRKSFFS